MIMRTPTLRPFFSFYGGKWRAAPRYPAPVYDTIIEPFAGSAGYSVRHPAKNVVLVERDPKVAATWRYLLNAKPVEILRLPDVPLDGSVDDIEACEEAKYLIGWWLNGGSATPKRSPGAWMRKSLAEGRTSGGGRLCWGSRVRRRIAFQMKHIAHWRLIEGDYTAAPDIAATWFIDPPYRKAGKHYRFGSALLDFEALGGWCKARRGQVMVCENVGADWLPFEPFADIQATPTKRGAKVSREALWTSAVLP